jgi:thiol:disulfide interchange protein DsbA
MNIFTRWLAVLMCAVPLTIAMAAENYTEGDQYLRLKKAQPTSTDDKIEVVELFWYGCPHCNDLEPFIARWLETKPGDVEFVRMPAIFGERSKPLARAYYTAEVLGVLDETHSALFKAIHEQQQKLNTDAEIQAFFQAHGVSEEEFRRTYNSFAVAIKLNNAELMTRRYAITGVPTLIVNGKYSTSGSQAGSHGEILKVVDYLVEQERAAGMPEQAATDGS